jgi:hypothetical protein
LANGLLETGLETMNLPFRRGGRIGFLGIFQQAVGQAFGAVLEAKAINLYFADSKSSGSNYDLLSQFTFWATIRLSEVMLNDPRHFQLPN